MKRIEFYQTVTGREPAREWLNDLSEISQAKVRAYIDRAALGGAKKNIRSLGDGIFEIKVDFGPGYRVYFGQIGNVMILLLLGGDKGTQFHDIHRAREYWRIHVSK